MSLTFRSYVLNFNVKEESTSGRQGKEMTPSDKIPLVTWNLKASTLAVGFPEPFRYEGTQNALIPHIVGKRLAN